MSLAVAPPRAPSIDPALRAFLVECLDTADGREDGDGDDVARQPCAFAGLDLPRALSFDEADVDLSGICAWLEGDLYNRDATPADDATAPVVSSYCDKVKCPLFERSRAMVLEFAVLFLALAYFQTWGLQEVGEVLVKKTKSAMMAAPEQEDGGSPYVPLSAGVQHEPPLGLPLE